jgi:hypothetical protein
MRSSRSVAQRAADGAKYANPRPLTQRPSQVFESRFDLFKWPEPCEDVRITISFNTWFSLSGAEPQVATAKWSERQ